MQINAFCAASLNRYRNFHRRLFAEDTTDANGQGKKSYPQRPVKTPLENLASLPDANILPQSPAAPWPASGPRPAD